MSNIDKEREIEKIITRARICKSKLTPNGITIRMISKYIKEKYNWSNYSTGKISEELNVSKSMLNDEKSILFTKDWLSKLEEAIDSYLLSSTDDYLLFHELLGKQVRIGYINRESNRIYIERIEFKASLPVCATVSFTNKNIPIDVNMNYRGVLKIEYTSKNLPYFSFSFRFEPFMLSHMILPGIYTGILDNGVLSSGSCILSVYESPEELNKPGYETRRTSFNIESYFDAICKVGMGHHDVDLQKFLTVLSEITRPFIDDDEINSNLAR